jgi:hypothetical protein
MQYATVKKCIEATAIKQPKIDFSNTKIFSNDRFATFTGVSKVLGGVYVYLIVEDLPCANVYELELANPLLKNLQV